MTRILIYSPPRRFGTRAASSSSCSYLQGGVGPVGLVGFGVSSGLQPPVRRDCLSAVLCDMFVPSMDCAELVGEGPAAVSPSSC